MEITHASLAAALSRLYGDRSFRPRAWPDSSDHAFLGIHLIERSVALLAPELRGELIDVGCGERPYASYLAHLSRQVACDFDAKRGPVDFACPADAIPVDAASFDAVLCTEVLEHVPDPLAVWREFYRILRPAGKVLLTTPMYWPSHEQPYDFYRYPAHGLAYLAEKAGFEVLDLLPRGGVWALLGQVVLHTIPQYLRWQLLRRALNRGVLALDRSRNNPGITLGWTILAEKPAPQA